MKRAIILLKQFSLLTLILLISSCEENKQGLIDQSTAIFYPANFIAEETLPSLIFTEEPQIKNEVPNQWDLLPVFRKTDSTSIVSFPVHQGVSLYGTGEVTGELLRNGKDITLWNTDNYTYSKADGKRLYQSHPFVLGVNPDGSSFGIIADNTWKQHIELKDSIRFISEGPAFRVAVIQEDSPQKVIQKLGELTGKIEMPPLWALGYQQCRYSYYPDSRVKEVASEFRKRKIPCDVIWMDIHYMQDFRIFTFDSINFPQPKELNDYLHSIDFKAVWMIDPGVKKDPGYFVYDQGTAADHWVKTSTGEDFVGDVWPGACVFPDFTRPETSAWWSGLYKDYMATGIDGVWNDMNEPAVFNTPDLTMPEDNIHRGGGEGELPQGIHKRYHNVYGMLMVKASREGILKVKPQKRPFILSRSNFLGGQRYAATWTGDNASSWEHMKMATPMSLSLGLSAQPFSGPDIGGYKGDADKELIAHWMAIGAFYPFCRNHTELSGRDQEPFAYNQKVEDVSRTALERRYALMPYLYTLFNEASETGMPVMRPVFFADPADQSLRSEEEAFLWGQNLLIVPQWAESPSLPQGIWRNIHLFETGVEDDDYQPTLKQKGGSIIPISKVIQSTEDYKTDSLTLMVCLDKQNKAIGELYHDQGDGFAYKQGEFQRIKFEASLLSENKLAVKCSQFEGSMNTNQRYYRVCLIDEDGHFYSGWNKSDQFEVTLP